VDFEQPRALWSKVWDDEAREHYVQNVAGHLGNVKSAEIKARQRASLLLDSSSLHKTDHPYL
jgi:catalase